MRKTTKYETFSIPREYQARRPLAVVHPISQLAISLLVTKHRAALRKRVSDSSMTLYDCSESPQRSRAFKGVNFRKSDQRGPAICANNAVILRADVSQFFHTIYTHSIPWAIIGKKKVKEWLSTNRSRLNAHWANDFDVALQSCQSRETLGIPVGPETSSLMAEVIMASVERDEPFRRTIEAHPGMRMVDDFMIGFDDAASAEQALGSLRTALWDFNLQLNDNKTSIVESRSVHKEKWQIEISRFVVSERSRTAQLSGIRDLRDLALISCEIAKTAQPAKACCTKLARLTRPDWNLSAILETMFRLTRAYPSCTSRVAEFLVNNRELCSAAEYRPAISTWVKTTLSKHFKRRHDYEVSWALLVAGVFDIRIADSDIPGDGLPSAIILSILMLLRDRGTADVSLRRWPWRLGFKPEAIYGEAWMFFYEAVLRKWTRDKRIVSAVRADPLLNQLLQQKISFLNDRIFEAGFIDLRRRVFNPFRKGGKKSGQSRGLQTMIAAWRRRQTAPSMFLIEYL